MCGFDPKSEAAVDVLDNEATMTTTRGIKHQRVRIADNVKCNRRYRRRSLLSAARRRRTVGGRPPRSPGLHTPRHRALTPSGIWRH